MVALLVIAQHTQEAKGGDAWWILATVVLIVVLFAAIWAIFLRGSKRSRGGVEPPPGSQRRGNPPFEGVRRGG